MMKSKILVVDDDLAFGDLLSRNLQEEGFEVKFVSCGAKTFATVSEWNPDIILVDYKLPDTDGFEICKQLKAAQSTRHIPVIMITGRNTETDIVTALELGAEDFLSKPFSFKVLVAKLRVNLRRKELSTSAPAVADSKNRPNRAEVNGIILDRNRFSAFVGEEEIRLTATQFKLLECLIDLPGFVLSREKIVKELSSQHFSITLDSVDVHIAGLRRKLGAEAGARIETLRGVGYRISES